MQETTTKIDRRVAIVMAAVLSLAFLFAPAFPLLASHAASTITVSVSPTSVPANSAYTVSGTVTSAGNNTAVYIVITNPTGTIVDSTTAVVGSTGAFSANFVAGGTGLWTSGTYTVTATWGTGVGSTISGTTTFSYSAPTTTATSSGGGGVTTTVIVTSATTTVVTSAVTSVTTINSATTLGGTTVTTVLPGTTEITTLPGTTVTTVLPGTTVTAVTTLSSVTTVNYTTSSTNNTGLYVAVLGVVIAIIAGAIAVMALRKK